jgi:hypothetical protein
MAVPVKIECSCGQHYAFEVEPEAGKMPLAVTCPACGADGTAAANDILARSAAPPPAAAAPGLRLRHPAVAVSVPEASPAETAAPEASASPTAWKPGQVDRTRAQNEARAKIMWGDPPEQAAQFLKMNGFGAEEAAEVIAGIVRERAAAVRGNGIRNLGVGAALVAVPIVAFVIFSIAGVLPLKLFGITVAIGLWGAWKMLSGAFMLLAPKWQGGDLAEQ